MANPKRTTPGHRPILAQSMEHFELGPQALMLLALPDATEAIGLAEDETPSLKT